MKESHNGFHAAKILLITDEAREDNTTQIEFVNTLVTREDKSANDTYAEK